MAEDGPISIAGQLPVAASDGGEGAAKPLDPRILEIARELGRMIARELFKALTPSYEIEPKPAPWPIVDQRAGR